MGKEKEKNSKDAPECRVWNIQVTKHMDDMVNEAICQDSHVTMSELVRTAVREKLQRMGLLKE